MLTVSKRRTRMAQVRVQEPMIVHREPMIEPRADPPAPTPAPAPPAVPRVWPEGSPMPSHFRRPAPQPCRKCRRVRLDDLSQAVVVSSGGRGGVVYMRCRACGHRFSLPVAEK